MNWLVVLIPRSPRFDGSVPLQYTPTVPLNGAVLVPYSGYEYIWGVLRWPHFRLYVIMYWGRRWTSIFLQELGRCAHLQRQQIPLCPRGPGSATPFKCISEREGRSPCPCLPRLATVGSERGRTQSTTTFLPARLDHPSRKFKRTSLRSGVLTLVRGVYVSPHSIDNPAPNCMGLFTHPYPPAPAWHRSGLIKG